MGRLASKGRLLLSGSIVLLSLKTAVAVKVFNLDQEGLKQKLTEL